MFTILGAAQPGITRRALLQACGGGLALSAIGILAACGGASPTTAATGSSSAVAPPSAATSSAAAPVTAATTSTQTAAATSASTAATSSASSTVASITTTATANSTPTTSSASITTAPAASSKVAAAPGGIDYWQYNAQVKDVEAKQVDIFMQQNPAIKVNYVVNSNFSDYFTKIDTSFAGGVPPDVWNTAPTYYFEYIQSNDLVRLDPLIQRDLDLTQFYTETLNQWDAPPGSGMKYGIPRDWVINVLYYNTDLLQRYGVQPPTDDWTWDNLRDAAAKITNDTGDGSTAHYGVSGWPFNDTILANGGTILNQQRTRAVVDQSPPALDTLSYLVGAVQVQKALPVPGYLKNKPWQEGRLGFNIALTTLVGSMRQTPVPFQWGVAKLPKGKVGRKAYGGPDGLVISNKPATVASSWQLVKFLISTAAQVPLCIAWGGLPVNKAAAATKEFLGARPADYQTGLDSAPFMYDLYNADYGKWMAALSKQVNAALSGTVSAKDALTQAAHDMNALLTQVYPNG